MDYNESKWGWCIYRTHDNKFMYEDTKQGEKEEITPEKYYELQMQIWKERLS